MASRWTTRRLHPPTRPGIPSVPAAGFEADAERDEQSVIVRLVDAAHGVIIWVLGPLMSGGTGALSCRLQWSPWPWVTTMSVTLRPLAATHSPSTRAWSVVSAGSVRTACSLP
jgi:hypothetical protein